MAFLSSPAMRFPPFPAKALTAAAVACSAVSFALMDADPSLWLFEKLVVNDRRLSNHWSGKRIWITGASSGIGAELAVALSKHNAALVLSGRNEERLNQVAKECGAEAVLFDVDCDQEEMDSIVERVGEVDVVILNAGAGNLAKATETSREMTEKLMRVNGLAPIHLTQTLLNQRSPPSHFVVTSSVAGKFAVPLSASYAAAKHAVQGYFTSLAAEQPGLRIDLPCPGPTATNFFGTKPSENERKMPASRCARLILCSMMLGYSGREAWIAQQPTLFFCYLHQVVPGFASFLLQKIIGPTRLSLYEAGLDLYDPASLEKLRKLRRQKEASKDE